MSSEETKGRVKIPFHLYVQHRDSLAQTLYAQCASYDKYILAFSSGAIALSLTFVEKMGGLRTWTKTPLAVSWGLFILAILSTLLSFLSSQRTHKALIDEWDHMCWEDNDLPKAESNVYDRRTRCLNRTSACLFVAGVLALVVFAIGNLW